MTTEHKDFEVISNSDPDMESESSNGEQSEISIKESNVIGNEYSQDDRSFLFDLYRENRDLLEQISEKDKKIEKLEERNIYLANSNVFWLCCYIGSSAIGLLSLIYR